jgi:hypothetical protein
LLLQTEMQADPPRRIPLKLSRPDISAREAVAAIRAHSPDLIRNRSAFYIASAGAADISGRLAIGTSAWQIGLRNSSAGNATVLSLADSGVLSIRNHATSGGAPPCFVVDGAWIDSALAVNAIAMEPLPQQMEEGYSTFMKLRQVDDVGVFWEIRRSYANPPTGLSITQTFAVHATGGDIVGEIFRQELSGTLLESRYRRGRGAGDWIDEMQQRPPHGGGK